MRLMMYLYIFLIALAAAFLGSLLYDKYRMGITKSKMSVVNQI